MKSSYIIYNLLINIEKSEQVLSKMISFADNEKIFKKLITLLNDLISIKKRLYSYINRDFPSEKINKAKIKEKYNEYKDIMSFL